MKWFDSIHIYEHSIVTETWPKKSSLVWNLYFFSTLLIVFRRIRFDLYSFEMLSWSNLYWFALLSLFLSFSFINLYYHFVLWWRDNLANIVEPLLLLLLTNLWHHHFEMEVLGKTHPVFCVYVYPWDLSDALSTDVSMCRTHSFICLFPHLPFL